jgi:hypothetical protein
MDGLGFRMVQEGSVWWLVFPVGDEEHRRVATLAEERFWLALQEARQALNELGVT